MTPAPMPIARGLTADDLAIAHLALDEAALRERVLDLEAERDIYRELLQRSLDELHGLIPQLDRLRAAQERLVDEYRRLREQILREDERTAA